MSFTQVLTQIKRELERSIRTATFNGRSYQNGNKAKEALIRSQRLIKYIHEFIKQKLIDNQINPTKIFPALGCSSPEINLVGLLKPKNQDICVIPDQLNGTNSEIIKGRRRLTRDSLMEKSVVINIRSQLSSLDNNFDTLFERTFAEPLNLRLRIPKLCMGEVYLIPTHEYDDEPMKRNRVAFFRKAAKIEKYIRSFQSINNRIAYTKDEYKYERIWLVLVDFRRSPPKLYSSVQGLINDGILSPGINVSLNKMGESRFVEDILAIYAQRFDLSLLH